MNIIGLMFVSGAGNAHEGEDDVVKGAVGEEMPKPFGKGLVRGGLHCVLVQCFIIRKTCWWSGGCGKDLL